MRWLYLGWNEIHTVESGAFQDLMQVQEIFMEESKIKSLDFNIFNPSKFLFLTIIYMVSYHVGTIFFGNVVNNLFAPFIHICGSGE